MQEDIFSKNKSIKPETPLADRLRPQSLEEYAGQDSLVGKDGIIRKLIEKDNMFSMILWGPPGVGKTTLSRIIANETKSKFLQISAVTSGKKDLQNVITQAKEYSQAFESKKTILFIDEIHRFNKIQQDYLLPFVEDGTVVLIGATTENPSFEIIGPLLSRCRVFTLKRHSSDDLSLILDGGIKYLQKIEDIKIDFEKGAKDFLIAKSNGDPRSLLNALEMAVFLEKD